MPLGFGSSGGLNALASNGDLTLWSGEKQGNEQTEPIEKRTKVIQVKQENAHIVTVGPSAHVAYQRIQTYGFLPTQSSALLNRKAKNS